VHACTYTLKGEKRTDEEKRRIEKEKPSTCPYPSRYLLDT